VAKAPANRRVKHQHDAMTAAKRGQCRVAAVHMQSAKPTRGSSPVERSHFKRAAAIVHENCQWSAARLAGPSADSSKYIVTWGAGSQREEFITDALKLAKRKSGSPFGASIYRRDKPGRGTLIATCANAVCKPVSGQTLSGAKSKKRRR